MGFGFVSLMADEERAQIEVWLRQMRESYGALYETVERVAVRGGVPLDDPALAMLRQMRDVLADDFLLNAAGASIPPDRLLEIGGTLMAGAGASQN